MTIEAAPALAGVGAPAAPPGGPAGPQQRGSRWTVRRLRAAVARKGRDRRRQAGSRRSVGSARRFGPGRSALGLRPVRSAYPCGAGDRDRRTERGRDRGPNAERGGRFERDRAAGSGDRPRRDGGRPTATATTAAIRSPATGRPRYERGSSGPAERVERADRRPRVAEPPLPDGLDMSMLDRQVRDRVAVAEQGRTPKSWRVTSSPPGSRWTPIRSRALAHARAARARASRLAVVREAVGVAAYHAQEWTEALTELRTARRISGDPRNLPIMADCERALGRPTQAVRMLSDQRCRSPGSGDPCRAVHRRRGCPPRSRSDSTQRCPCWLAVAWTGSDRARGRCGSGTPTPTCWPSSAAPRRRPAGSPRQPALDVEGDTDAAERAADLL